MIREKVSVVGTALVISAALAVICLLPTRDEDLSVILEFVGGFHPLILHLPIGLWFGVLCLMAACRFVKDPLMLAISFWAAQLTLYTGIVAFGAGFMLYLAGGYSLDVLAPHMYGSLAFLMGVAVQVWFLRADRFGAAAYGVAGVTSVLLGYAGHMGGVMTHGEPMDKAPWVVFEKRKQAATNAPTASEAGKEKFFADLIYPIFTEKCINCHGVERSKGKLRMDSIAALLKGGAQGPSLIASDPKASLVMKRIHLDLDNKKHMPPKGKPQLNPDEIALIEFWIAGGAKEGQLVSKASIPVELEAFVQSLIGDSPEAIARRKAIEKRNGLLERYDVLRAAFPGVMVQSVQGQSIFELSSASIYDLDEAKLRSKIAPLAEEVIRLDWVNRDLEPEWQELFTKPKHLKVLNLSLSKVSNEQLVELLMAHPQLEKLNLTGTSVDDQVIDPLMTHLKNGHLKFVILTESHISTESLSKIQRQYPNLNLIF